MSHRSILAKTLSIALLTLLSGAGFASASGDPESRAGRNILLITADDLGVQLGCYGEDQARTPHLDKLAEQGMRFANAYVTQSSCSPSRSSIFTGLYPHQNGMIGLAHYGRYRMDPDLAVLPHELGEAGYHTGVIGKIHVGPHPDMNWDWRGMGTRATRDVQAVADQAEEYWNRLDGEEPFFLMVNYFDPHKPLVDQSHGVPSDPIRPNEVKPFAFLAIDTPGVRQEVAGFLNSTQRLDTGVGLLLEKLAAADHAEDTLVIFVGDHGPPMIRAKTTNYESGIRVPFIVRGPQVSETGSVSDKLISTIDIVPTLADVAGTQWPNAVPGRSLLPLLKNEATSWRQYLFAEYNAHGPNHYYPRRSVRDARYKLIVNSLHEQENPVGGLSTAAWNASQQAKRDDTVVQDAFDRYRNPPAIELYDLHKDPTEMVNLADKPEYQDVRHRLLRELRDWQKRTNDFLLGEVDHRRIKQDGLPPENSGSSG